MNEIYCVIFYVESFQLVHTVELPSNALLLSIYCMLLTIVLRHARHLAISAAIVTIQYIATYFTAKVPNMVFGRLS